MQLRHSSILGRRLTGLMLLRVILVSVFLGLTLLVNATTIAELSSTQNILYLGVIVFTYLITIGYAMVLRWRGPSVMLAYTQIIIDLLIAITLVSISGGHHSSPFLFTLYLPIIAAAVLSEMRTALITASGVALITVITTLVYINILPAPLDTMTISSPATRQLLLEAGLNISFTYLLAWSSGQLARQLGEAKTEIARTQIDIKNLQTLNEDILANLNSGLITVDHALHIIFFNRAAEDITGLTLDDVFARPLDSIFPKLSHTLETNQNPNARHEFHYVHPESQTTLFLGFSSSPLRDAQNAQTGYIIIFQDLSTFRELELLAKRHEKLAAIGQLSAAIAHEIRNPLASISGSVEMLQAITSLDEDEVALMDIILREVERLNHLISEFLDYSRPHKLTKEPTNVIVMIEETLQLFRHHSHAITVTLEVDPDYPRTLRPPFDREAVRSVIWNLLVNAAQAMTRSDVLTNEALTSASEHSDGNDPAPDVLLIEVRVSLNEGMLLIEVEDDGCGIDETNHDHIFEPFFTTKTSGTGLGLATAFRIIEEHGGDLELQPPRKLQGARFLLSLPDTPSS